MRDYLVTHKSNLTRAGMSPLFASQSNHMAFVIRGQMRSTRTRSDMKKHVPLFSIRIKVFQPMFALHKVFIEQWGAVSTSEISTKPYCNPIASSTSMAT